MNISSAPIIEVVNPGLLALVEDRGRPGFAQFGVGRSGAADLPSFDLGNRLVGNHPSAAGIELTLGGAVFRFPAAAVIAVTGAVAPVAVDGRDAACGVPLLVDAGAELRIGRPRAGVRSYLAVRGGVDVPPVLGSRSRDTLGGLGPPPLSRGDRVPIGADIAGPVARSVPYPAGGAYVGVHAAQRHAGGTGHAGTAVPDPPAAITLRVRPGPRQDWFTAEALDVLFAEPYQVTPSSDRVGMRLHGRPLRYAATRELPPEGMVTGALQVPPDGQPVLFLADHPVTGGYPVIGVVRDADVALAAQAAPGRLLRLRPA
jgi:biotin-dependent carboxylase-like uncharacterized protein